MRLREIIPSALAAGIPPVAIADMAGGSHEVSALLAWPSIIITFLILCGIVRAEIRKAS